MSRYIVFVGDTSCGGDFCADAWSAEAADEWPRNATLGTNDWAHAFDAEFEFWYVGTKCEGAAA